MQVAKKKGKTKEITVKTKQYQTYKIPKYDKNGKYLGKKKVKSRVKMNIVTYVYKGKFDGDYVIIFTENGPIDCKKIKINAKSPLKKTKETMISI